ncbi:FecR domain-containing protein [Luteibacter sp. dw_328]|uniref:FecR domain-containing protein n=1 Tax=Luteibacter sp. dw_328 TaxID=2719796 RepID=UPI001BD609EA|nr:FecR domain-containing protein [Luteibacter sp. dw_328]
MVDNDAIRQASAWFARLQADANNGTAHAAWRDWLDAEPAHREAWLLVEQVQGRFAAIPSPRSAAQALSARELSRRRALGQIAIVAGLGTAGALGLREVFRQHWLAGYRTATGERRQVTLPDGSQLILNTATALDVAFSGRQRLLRLHAGEILLTTAADPAPSHRPLVVQTPQGEATALGTRFTVFAEDGESTVAVLEKAVRVQPANAPAVTVDTGHQLRFTRDGSGPLQANDAFVASWESGSIIAIDMPLGELVRQLDRYRPGRLVCAGNIAGLRISGAFPIDDTDRALAALTRSFPVRAVRRTRYWVSVEAAQAAG